jgi:hypothetical protein
VGIVIGAAAGIALLAGAVLLVVKLSKRRGESQFVKIHPEVTAIV